jgi:hypothetical protein
MHVNWCAYIAGHYDSEDPYPSLSDYHDYEPQLEFDDSELLEQKPEDLGDEGRRIPYVMFNAGGILRVWNVKFLKP